MKTKIIAISIIGLVVLDQIIKINLHQKIENSGFLFGFMQNNQSKIAFMLAIAFFLVILAIVFFVSKNYWHKISISLIFLGGINNFVDRIRFGASLDYLKIGICKFNIADLMIYLGIILIISNLFFLKTTQDPYLQIGE